MVQSEHDRPATADKPRIGVPWRTSQEERENIRRKLDYYLSAVRDAGGDAEEILLLQSPTTLKKQVESFDGFVLPGSPADVNPALYGAERHPETQEPDAQRENTDRAILEHAFVSGKPVLAICYGCQSLNVALGGSLYQDIASELRTEIRHSRQGLAPEELDPMHSARIEPGNELGQLAAACGLPRNGAGFEARVNTSHHQSIRDLGQGLKVAAVAPDGVIEGVEHEPHKHWVVGVQWHPERMQGDALAAALFRALVRATRAAAARR